MSFVPEQQAQRVFRLAVATELVNQAVENEIRKMEDDQKILAFGIAAHLSNQIQLLLEVMSGVTPTRTGVVLDVTPLDDGGTEGEAA